MSNQYYYALPQDARIRGDQFSPYGPWRDYTIMGGAKYYETDYAGPGKKYALVSPRAEFEGNQFRVPGGWAPYTTVGGTKYFKGSATAPDWYSTGVRGSTGAPGATGPQGPQGPQGAAGAKGLDALPEAYDPRYGWANPYNQASAPVPMPQDTGYGFMPIAPGGGAMNPIQLMSQFSGYGSPRDLMDLQAGQLAPGQMRRRI